MNLLLLKGRTMSRLVLCIVLLTGQQTLAADDLEFATPVVTEASPTCDNAGCHATGFAHSRVVHQRGRRTIASWFRERRPVRRVLRGVAKLVVHRCGR